MPVAAKCGFCDAGFKKQNDPGVKCDACKRWYHFRCTNATETTLAALKEVDTNKLTGFRWFCQLCDGTVSEILSNLQKYKKVDLEIKKIRARMSKCETEGKNSDKLIKRVEKAELINHTVVVDLEEQKNIEWRKKNIIFFGVPEVDSEDIEEELNLEFKMVQHALTGKETIAHEEVVDILRLGKKLESNATKPRPLLFKMDTEENKQRILKATGDLSIKANNEKIPIYASNDPTKKQRDELNELKAQLKKIKEKGEENIGIRGNKIVKLHFFRERRENRTRNIWARIKNKKSEQEELEEREEEPEDDGKKD